MTDTTTSSARTNLDATLSRLRSEPAFRNYERVREWVLELKDAYRETTASVESPSDYWLEELSTLGYLFDASPLVVERLRHHMYTVTGLRPYDYRTGKDRARDRFARKLEALAALDGPGLLVPEAPALGGFGHEIDGALYNIDTLKFYEVLIALERGAVLGAFRESERRVVWEIGAGWGGFAFQFKTLFPRATYVIVDLPELFLFSATYLLTLFPHATSVFHRPGASLPPEAWLTADFVFVPNGALHELDPPRLDLTVNMISFQEMTTAQVQAYVRKAYDLDCPFLYSLNRERSLYNSQLESVTAILDAHYWTQTIPVLPVSYLKMLDDRGAPKTKERADADLDYQHVLGRRRIVA